MLPLPTWPTSEYKASAPVVARKIDPSIKIPTLLAGLNRILIAQTGLSASKIDQSWDILAIPVKPKKVNQTNIIGPKALPIILVPILWIEKSRSKMTIVIAITTLWFGTGIFAPNFIFFSPSIEVVTVTAGVRVPSASNAVPPTKAGITNHLARLRTKA